MNKARSFSVTCIIIATLLSVPLARAESPSAPNDLTSSINPWNPSNPNRRVPLSQMMAEKGEGYTKQDKERALKACEPFFKEFRAKGLDLNRALSEAERDRDLMTGAAVGTFGMVAIGGTLAVLTVGSGGLLLPVLWGVAATGAGGLGYSLYDLNKTGGPKVDCLAYAVKSGMNLNISATRDVSVTTLQSKTIPAQPAGATGSSPRSSAGSAGDPAR